MLPFGMKAALIAMITKPEMFKAVIDRITDFYLKANEIFYMENEDRLDAVLIGNDFGSQTSLLLSRSLIRKHVWPGTKKLIDQVKSHRLKVIYRSCSAIYDIISDLIELGVDAIHRVHARAKNMEASRLKKEYGGKVSFCGGVDAQELLVNGTLDQVRKME